MKLRCIKEARRENGDKIMNFTKGKDYFAFSGEEGAWEVMDDNGTWQTFFNLKIMFKEI